MSAIFTYLYRVLEHCEESEYSIRSNSYASCGVEHVAEECAADYQRNHGGRESNWPLTFKVFDVGGKHLGTCIVEREVRPVFSAVLLSKESQIAAKAAELFAPPAPPGDGGERVTEIVRVLYERTGIIDNGRCVLCGAERYWTRHGSNAPPSPCENKRCVSHEIDALLQPSAPQPAGEQP